MNGGFFRSLLVSGEYECSDHLAILFTTPDDSQI